ncbi:MAG: hypothetical protein ABI595_04675 [Actinomycetota bacterium]
MKRTLTIIGLSLAGMALAVGVSVAAFALVGDSLSEPSTGKIQVPAASKGPTDDATHSQSPSPSAPSATASPSDDHGGDSGGGGGGGSEPGDDSGGSGGGHGSDD